MTVIELIMHLRKSVSDNGMDIAVADGNGKYIPLTEDNLVIGCCGSCANFQNEEACGNGFCQLNECESTCGQWCKGFKEREHERGFDD